jgi:predicted PurR-regulated permease PerM
MSATGTETRARRTVSLVFSYIVRTAAFVLLAWLAWRARVVIVTVLASVLVAVTLAPFVDRLAQPEWLGLAKRTRRSFAAFVVFVVLVVFLFFAGKFILTPFFRDLKDLIATISSEVKHWEAYYKKIQDWVAGLPPEVRGLVTARDFGALSATVVKYLQRFVVTGAHWIQYVVELIVIPILAFYFIVEDRAIRREWVGLIPRRYRREALVISGQAARIMRNYIGANLVLCIIAAIIVYTGLRLLGVPYALSLGILAGITRFVPVIGPILGGIPILIVAMAVSPGVGIAVLTFFVLMHLFESKVLLPKLVGSSLDISGALVLIALLLGYEYGGLVGVFVAAPLAALARVLILRSNERRRRLRRAAAGPRPGLA